MDLVCLGQFELGQVGLDLVGLGQVKSGQVGLDWNGLGWVGLVGELVSYNLYRRSGEDT